MSATHLSDNLPTFLHRFQSMLGHRVSETRLQSRNYSFEYELDPLSSLLTETDFKSNPMESSSTVRTWMRKQCEHAAGCLVYCNITSLHQGWTNLKGVGQMTAPEMTEYKRAKLVAPGELPAMPDTLKRILRTNKEYNPLFNHNAGAALVAVRELLPHDQPLLTRDEMIVRNEHFHGVTDTSIALVMTQKDAGCTAGVVMSWITPSMATSLDAKLVRAKRPWLGMLVEGFEEADTNNVNEFLKLCVQARLWSLTRCISGTVFTPQTNCRPGFATRSSSARCTAA